MGRGSAYATMAVVPEGTSPGGGWLLFAYLAFAEQLKDDYETAQRILQGSGPAERGSVQTRPLKTQSQFAKALARKLAKTGNVSSEVHWGNEGFCVDIAALHPSKVEDVTLGIQCDLTRFEHTDDPIEWDLFQSTIHKREGWTLKRIWSPHFFRDPEGVLKSLNEDIAKASV